MGRRLDIGVYGARGIPSTYSGYETFLGALLPELAARGHVVTMYCRSGEVPKMSTYRGVRCVHLPAIHSKQLSTLSHGLLAAARSAVKRHDVVLVVNVANAASAFLLRAVGGRVVLNTDGQEWLRGKWGPVGRKVFLLSARLARWSSNGLVSDCPAMRDVYRARFGSDSTVIPYCWTELQPVRTGATFDRLAIRPHQYFVVGGRLVPENNIVEIAEAYLAGDIAQPLVVLGAGAGRSPVTDGLRRLAVADERLVLAGHIDDRSVFAGLIAEATAYLHGHSVGGINPSLLEAMGCGARIVSLDTPFNREALGSAGDYFDQAADLVPLLQAMSDDPSRSEQLRKDAHSRARKQFALSDVASAYEELLLDVADSGKSLGRRISTRWDGQALRVFNEIAPSSEPTESSQTAS
ncbi:MAG TPA: DUF1972 domain-containing protein [Acidimicrobiales bacterium]|nr:DUF1972 domain-containing protein [Acidimicrobiales bacterium]